MEPMTLFHGSPQIVAHPFYGGGRPYNDYGHGFYCTEHIELAREWACSEEGYDGYANEYRFDGRGFKVLELSSPEYSRLHWLALLLEHRKIDLRTPVAQAGSEFLRAHYLLDAESFDVIVGHRADDSYFTFARAFLRNDISLEQLTRALRLGDLGQQIVLKSPRAFEAIKFVEATVAPSAVYYPKRKERDEKARALYREEAARQGIDGIYLRDLLRDEVTDLAGL